MCSQALAATRTIAAVAGAFAHRAATSYRLAVTGGAVVVVAAWVAAAVLLPIIVGTGSGNGNDSQLGGLLPAHSHALQVQKQVLERFDVPVLSEMSVVVHNPAGLTALTRADVVAWALVHDQATLNDRTSSGPGHIIGAVPVPTATPQTAVTYLYVSAGTSMAQTESLGRQYAAHFHNQASVSTYLTGLLPAQLAQQRYIQSRLGVFALASLALVAMVVAFTFRSLVAPLVVLGVFAAGYFVIQPLLGLLADALGFPFPQQLQPLIVALLLGVVTDYSVLLFASLRTQLEHGGDHDDAVRHALRSAAGIITVAGVTVTGGTMALMVANLQLFRAFGPALAFTVLVGLALSLTLTPAVMTLLGHRLLRWRGTRPGQAGRLSVGKSTLVALLVRTVTRRSGAAAALVAGTLLLGAVAAPLLWMRLNVSFTDGLPSDDQARRGAAVLADAHVRGVTAPTEVLIRSRGVSRQREALSRLQNAVGQQPGVAEVLGPAQNPLPDRFGVVLSHDGDAARLLVIFDSDPLSAPAISDLRHLQGQLPALAVTAGLRHARVDTTGLTAIASELTDRTRVDLRLTLLAAFAIELLILIIYLRALVAPIAVLLCSALSVAAALGLTVLVFQVWLGDPGLTFYAPFATAILLFALGSDYNVFSVGAIWQEARHRPLARALTVAVPRSSRAVAAAGLILSATFALVAIIPLETFRQVAFTMAVGLLIDTLIVRTVLTPSLLTLLGHVAGWPSHRIYRTDPAAPPAAASVPTAQAIS